MHHVELRQERPVGQNVHGVGDNQLERVVVVRLDVDTGHVEAGAVVADGTATRAAEQV